MGHQGALCQKIKAKHQLLKASHHCLKVCLDAALAGLVSSGDESDEDALSLKISKTKEMMVDFRKEPSDLVPVTIKGIIVTQVTTYDYLGITEASDLSWHANIKRLANKAMKQLYHLRKL